jgi:hypothetical protein
MKTRPKLRMAFASWVLYWLPEGVVCGAVVAALGFGLMALAVYYSAPLPQIGQR